MRPIDECSASFLRWTQPRAGRCAYQLRAEPLGPEEAESVEGQGTALVATLRYQSSARAVAKAAAGHWTFRRSGFWHPRVSVWAADSASAEAVFSARWTGTGTLELSVGRRMHWSAAHVWQAEDGTPLVETTIRPGMTRLEGAVALSPAAACRPDLALLVLLGWYLVVLQAQDMPITTAALVPVLT
jgi:hypothetical protein